ncbi:hypothetical protein, partial [Bifidobacterium longum]|uniref:hypothetical protein n=1 Tax=Bifidobacterium longum TaxID=216816 RepID=UPI001E5B17B5
IVWRLKIVPGTVHVPFHQGRNPKMRKNPDVIHFTLEYRDTLSGNTGNSRTVTDHWPERYSASAVTWGMVMTESHHDRSLIILG